MIKRGFTLIELLVVITILAILAGAALPYVQNYVAESRIAKAKTDLEEIARALAVYETREGDYTKGTVADLTGRYLNKAPIDPWGRPYVIATASGLVISGGPDRLYDVNDMKDGDNADNIQAPYQPPLALVSIKWIDRNQSGAVDTQNEPDQIQLQFSRKCLDTGNAPAALTGTIASFVSHLDTVFELSTTYNMTQQFQAASSAWLMNERVLVLTVATGSVTVGEEFVPGSDTIKLVEGANRFIYDYAGNKCLTNQPVIILPQ